MEDLLEWLENVSGEENYDLELFEQGKDLAVKHCRNKIFLNNLNVARVSVLHKKLLRNNLIKAARFLETIEKKSEMEAKIEASKTDSEAKTEQDQQQIEAKTEASETDSEAKIEASKTDSEAKTEQDQQQIEAKIEAKIEASETDLEAKTSKSSKKNK